MLEAKLTKKQISELENIIDHFSPYDEYSCNDLANFIDQNTCLSSTIEITDDDIYIIVQGCIKDLFGEKEDIWIELDYDLSFMGKSDLLEKLDRYINLLEKYNNKNKQFLSLNY